jgi:hypothetical protein
VYYYAVLHYGDEHAVRHYPPSIAVALLADVLVAMAVQVCFASLPASSFLTSWRKIYYSFILYRFSSSPYISMICTVLAILGGGLLAYVAIDEVSSSDPLLAYDHTRWAAYLSSILRCGIDFVLAATMCYYLSARSSSDLNSTTKTILNTVRVYAIREFLCIAVGQL